jgi:hypothetical protein
MPLAKRIQRSREVYARSASARPTARHKAAEPNAIPSARKCP